MNGEVADVDLHDVVQEQHANDPVAVHCPAGMLVEDQRVHAQVPGVFGGIFLAALVKQR